MLRWIVGASLQSRYIVAAIAAGLVYYGLSITDQMSVDILPEFSEPYVEVQTEALGLSAAEVEALITVPLEADMLNGAPWLQEIRSQSIPGLSSIVMVFEPGTDVLRARQMVMERLTEVFTLPNVSKPPVIVNPVSSAGRVMMIGLDSKRLSPIEISVLARWTIAPRLSGVDGVANVSVWGERRRQLQVQVDPARLKEMDVRLQQVIKTAGNALWYSPLTFLDASTPGTSGFIDTPNQRLGVRHRLPISTAEELSQIPVEGSDKRLGDVATVVEDHQPLIGDALVNGEPGIVLVVEKFPWANTTSVTTAVEEALDSLRPGLTGLEMDPMLFRPAAYIESASGNLSNAFLLAGALIVVAVGLFWLEARAAVIATVTILLSYVLALTVLHLCGVTINAMVLAGLVMGIGVVVDDAVVNVDGIVRRIRQHRQAASSESFAHIVREAALELRGTMVIATVLLLLFVMPAYFVGGIQGAFLQPIASAYGLAIAASMLVELTVTPALGVMLLPTSRLKESQVMSRLQRSYSALLASVVQVPRPMLISACLLAAAGVALFLSLRPGSLQPVFKERDILVEIEHAPGTSHPAMARILRQATDELKSISGVRSVSGHLGRAVLSDKVNDVNRGQLWVCLEPDADYDESRKRIRKAMDGFPGVDIDTLTYLDACVHDPQRTGAEDVADDDIVVRVYGDRWDVLRRKTNEVKNVVAAIEGISSVEAELPVEEPQIEIEVNMEAAKKHGVKPGDVRRAATTLISGLEVGYLFEQQKVFDVVVWGAPNIRDNLTKIQNLLIDTPDGHVRLADVASVRIASAPTVIRRETVARYMDVTSRVKGRDVASVAKDVERRLREIDFPLEYRAELMRSSAARIEARNKLVAAVIAAAIGVFLVLHACIGSWRLAAAIFATLPAAVAGCAAAAYALEGGWTLAALLGTVAVLGVTVRGCLATIKHFQLLTLASADAGRDTNGEAAQRQGDGRTPMQSAASLDDRAFAAYVIERGGWERFAPVIMTATIMAAAVVPLILMGEAPGSEILRPMAIVILGGLVTSTTMILMGVPALYLMFTPKPELELDDLHTSLMNERELTDAIRARSAAETGV
jgi:Cu/Ag efflux pump CusA